MSSAERQNHVHDVFDKQELLVLNEPYHTSELVFRSFTD
jgi:hypothetical protein